MRARILSAAVGATLLATPALAASGNCPPSGGSAARTAENATVTFGTDFAGIPNALVRFTVTGGPRCVYVRFSGSTVIFAGGGMGITAVLDGTKQLAPGPINFQSAIGDSNVISSQSFEFFAPNVADGDHKVRIHWRSLDGQQIQISERTTSVTH